MADEIVIADCGMSDEARRIAQQYDVKLITGSDPKEHGFETPRNEALAACSLEWVLWIDTDEKLLNPAYLNKYLRRNIFNGYSLATAPLRGGHDVRAGHAGAAVSSPGDRGRECDAVLLA